MGEVEFWLGLLCVVEGGEAAPGAGGGGHRGRQEGAGRSVWVDVVTSGTSPSVS